MSYLEKLLLGVVVEWKPLGEICSAITSGKNKIRDDSGSYPIFGSTGVIGRTTAKVYEDEQILVARVGANAGYVHIARGEYDVSDNTLIIQIKELIIFKYLYYLLVHMNLNQFAQGAGQPLITAGQLKSLIIPIPPLPVQKQIVRILDTFTDLTTELTTELTARKQQYYHYREQLLCFKEGEVEWKTLGEIGVFQRGKRFVKEDMTTEGVPCIHYGEMYTHYNIWAIESKSFLSEELVERKKLRVAEKGDVVIVAAGETIEDIGMGTAWLGDEGVVIHDACFSYKSFLNAKYVAYFTRTKQFHNQIKKYISSGKISSINASGLSKVVIPVPPPKEQQRIAYILDKFDTLTTSIDRGLPKEVELRKRQYEHYRKMLLEFSKNN
jgi:type I restriction enzyme S subunit